MKPITMVVAIGAGALGLGLGASDVITATAIRVGEDDDATAIMLRSESDGSGTFVIYDADGEPAFGVHGGVVRAPSVEATIDERIAEAMERHGNGGSNSATPTPPTAPASAGAASPGQPPSGTEIDRKGVRILQIEQSPPLGANNDFEMHVVWWNRSPSAYYVKDEVAYVHNLVVRVQYNGRQPLKQLQATLYLDGETWGSTTLLYLRRGDTRYFAISKQDGAERLDPRGASVRLTNVREETGKVPPRGR